MQASGSLCGGPLTHPVLPELAPETAEIEILTADSQQASSSAKPYITAYTSNSSPLLLPIPSDQPTDNPDEPLLVSDRVKATRAAIERKKQKTAASKRDSIPDALKSPRGTVLPRFASANSRAPLDLPPESACERLNDVVFNVGGVAWTMDWLPAPPRTDGTEAVRQFLVMGVHPKGKELNPIGRSTSGKAMLQIWEVQHEPVPPATKAALPRLALGLCHDHGIAWETRWCPNGGAGDCGWKGPSGLQRLGLLAVVFGDGVVEVLSVPHPDTFAPADGAAHEPPRPAFARLTPKATADTTATGCLGNCLDWLPTLPHDLLLVGCWDGSVLVYSLAPSLTAALGPPGPGVPQLQLLSHIIADHVALRSVMWAPALEPEQGQGTYGRRIFCTAGHSSVMKIWDLRDPFRPIFELPAHVSWVTNAVWQADPPGIMTTQDDGALRFSTLYPFIRPKHEQKTQCSWWGGTHGTLWTCHVSPISGHTAYAGDGGEVVVAVPRFMTKSRQRPAHVVISSTRYVDRVLCMMGQETPRETVGTRLPVIKGDITNPQCAMFCVRWGCARSSDPHATWVASAGASGVVRCQRIGFFATF